MGKTPFAFGKRLFGQFARGDVGMADHGAVTVLAEGSDHQVEPVALLRSIAGILESETGQFAVEHGPDAFKGVQFSPVRLGNHACLANRQVVHANAGS